MKYSKKEILAVMENEQYPKSSKYDPDWILENAIGSHCLWLQESLTHVMNFHKGMQVLDLGCGKAITSIFLAKEFDVNVWAVDLNVNPTENWRRISEINLKNNICPIQADACSLPFAEGYFDALTSINSIFMYVTDAAALKERVIKYVKPGGEIGIIVPGFLKEYHNNFPTQYLPFVESDNLTGWHSLEWWIDVFEQTQSVQILTADCMEKNEGSEIFSKSAIMYNAHEHPFNVAAKDDYTFIRIVAKVK